MAIPPPASQAPSSPWLMAALPLPARSRVIDALELRDVVVLLSCNRALRHDHETASLALRGYDLTRHFGRGCTLDWCLPVPAYLLSDAEQQESCALDHAGEPPLWFEQSGDACVKLLSLTGCMAYALDQVLYRSFAVDSVFYTALPFVLPTARDEPTPAQPETELEADKDLAHQLGGLQLATHGKKELRSASSDATSRVTPLALHFENITVDTDAYCAFCAMVEDQVDTYTLEGFAYLLHRDASVRAAGEQLRADGCNEDSEEWAATVAYFERLDALYDQDLIDEEDAPEIMRRLIECNELPPLRRMEVLASHDNNNSPLCDTSELVAVANAVADAAHADFTDHTCKHLCVPLRRVIDTSGFRNVRHETIDNAFFPSVEKISGIAPCGFVAGMMIVSGDGVGTVTT